MWKIAWLLEKAYRWVVFVILIRAARLHVASTQDKRDAWICSPHPSRLWMSRNQTEDLFIFWRNTTSEYKRWPREVTGIKQHTWTPFSFAKNSHVKYITRGKTKIIEFAFLFASSGTPLLSFQLICGPLFKCISFRICVKKTFPSDTALKTFIAFQGCKYFSYSGTRIFNLRKTLGQRVRRSSLRYLTKRTMPSRLSSAIPDKENNAFSSFLCHILPLWRTFTLEWNTT